MTDKQYRLIDFDKLCNGDDTNEGCWHRCSAKGCTHPSGGILIESDCPIWQSLQVPVLVTCSACGSANLKCDLDKHGVCEYCLQARKVVEDE